jgi:hypothetical protein
MTGARRIGHQGTGLVACGIHSLVTDRTKRAGCGDKGRAMAAVAIARRVVGAAWPRRLAGDDRALIVARHARGIAVHIVGKSPRLGGARRWGGRSGGRRPLRRAATGDQAERRHQQRCRRPRRQRPRFASGVPKGQCAFRSGRCTRGLSRRLNRIGAVAAASALRRLRDGPCSEARRQPIAEVGGVKTAACGRDRSVRARL